MSGKRDSGGGKAETPTGGMWPNGESESVRDAADAKAKADKEAGR